MNKTSYILFPIITLNLICQTALSQTIDQRELSTGYAHMVSFTAEPEIAAATFDISDDADGAENQELKTLKLPLYKEFESDDHEWSWFVQGALSYLHYTEDLNLAPQESIRFRWRSYSALVDGGVILPLAHGFSFASSLGLGVAELENDARFSNDELEDELEPGLEGVVYNWDSLSSIARFQLGLLYDKKFGHYRLKGDSHISLAYIDSFSESRDFPGFSDHASTFSLKVDLSHPLNVSVRDYPLYVVGHVGNTTFLGSGRDVLGFNSFSEIGASLGISKITVGALLIFGKDVDGWTLTFNYDY